MSYILEALKKADQQRELGKVPGLDAGYDGEKPRWAGYWPWILAVVLLLNAVVLAVLFWPGKDTATVEAPVAAPTPESPPPAARVARATQEPAPAPVARQPRPLKPIPAPAPEPEPPAPRPAATGIDPDAARLALARSLLPEGSAEMPAPEPEPEPAPPPRSRAADLPVWPQIPQHLFSRLSGGIHLDVHVYADQPASRFVLINMRKYYEGERLQEGPVLDEITPEGVILSFQGERFRVQAQ